MLGFVDLVTRYTASQQAQIRAVVQNVGFDAPAAACPSRCSTTTSPQTTVYVNLLTAEIDTVALRLDRAQPRLRHRPAAGAGVLPRRQRTANDSVSATVTIVGTPLAGQYDLGGGRLHYANFQAALADMLLRGVGGEVDLQLLQRHLSRLHRARNRRRQRAAPRHVPRRRGGPGDAGLRHRHQRAALERRRPHHLRRHATCARSGTVNVCVLIDNGADSNQHPQPARSPAATAPTARRAACEIHFLGNDGNVIDNVRISGVNYGVRLEGGGSADRSSDLEVRNCTISGGNYGVYLDNCTRARIHDNDIQPYGHDVISVYGVYVAGLTVGDTVCVYNNRIHNLRQSYVSTFPMTAAHLQQPGHGGGHGRLLLQQLHLRLQPSTAAASTASTLARARATSISTASASATLSRTRRSSACTWARSLTTATLLNNIIAIEGADLHLHRHLARERLPRALRPQLLLRHRARATSRAATPSTSAPTLAAWQFTGRDLNSVAGNPQFVSATDLHIYAANALLSGAGAYLPAVACDIDGEPRANPPDIGADEYGISPLPGLVTGLTVFPEVETGERHAALEQRRQRRQLPRARQPLRRVRRR